MQRIPASDMIVYVNVHSVHACLVLSWFLLVISTVIPFVMSTVIPFCEINEYNHGHAYSHVVFNIHVCSIITFKLHSMSSHLVSFLVLRIHVYHLIKNIHRYSSYQKKK